MGHRLKEKNLKFDRAYSSVLKRAVTTLDMVLDEIEQQNIPIIRDWRLNERHYGDLVGKNKKEVVLQFGKDQVKRWRRSYDEPPPTMEDNHPFHPAKDPRYHLVSLYKLKCRR